MAGIPAWLPHGLLPGAGRLLRRLRPGALRPGAKKFLTLPPYLVRAASQALTPELKARVKKVLKR